LSKPDRHNRSPYPWPALTPREREVLGLLAEGLTTQQIADRLGRSYWTVRIHQRNIVRKMNARDRTHAACLAVTWEMGWETKLGARSMAIQNRRSEHAARKENRK